MVTVENIHKDPSAHKVLKRCLMVENNLKKTSLGPHAWARIAQGLLQSRTIVPSSRHATLGHLNQNPRDVINIALIFC